MRTTSKSVDAVQGAQSRPHVLHVPCRKDTPMFRVSRLSVVSCLFMGALVCHGIANGTEEITSLFAEELQGSWKGAQGGTTVTLSFKGRDAKWKVNQKTRRGEESITAGPMECVVVSKAGWVDLLLPTAKTDAKGNPAEPQHVGRLHRDGKGRIVLKIYPVDRYRPVEGLILHHLPSTNPKP